MARLCYSAARCLTSLLTLPLSTPIPHHYPLTSHSNTHSALLISPMAGQLEHRRRRVVLFPLPFEGHITPMLQLAALLHARGLAVTVLHTDFNAPDPSRRHPPEIAFVPIHEAFPDEVTSPGADIATKLLALNAACEAPFRHALAYLLLREEDDVACAVVDGQCYAALRAASDLGVPALALRTDSAATFHTLLAYQRLRDAGYLPVKEEMLDDLVPDHKPLRVRDLIRVDGSDGDALFGFIASATAAVRDSSSGVVLNTFEGIEAPEVAKIRRELSRPAFAVGPLHLLSPSPAKAAAHAPDSGGCLAWLDARPPRSLLYVSLGSVATIDRATFEEMAWGLAGSGVPFLWVVRAGLVTGAGEDDDAPPLLPEGFREETGSRGKVVAWAPQRVFLAHAAVGAFWTHCGWNSTMESVCAGVPMLVQPCFADQMANARYVTHEWGVGMEVGDVVERGTVAEVVRKMMVGEDGARMRERARRLKMEASAATSLSIDSLIDYISSL